MKRKLIFIFSLVFLSFYAADLSPKKMSSFPKIQNKSLAAFAERENGLNKGNPEINKTEILNMLSNLPLYFVDNRGQMDERVWYSTKSGKRTIYFTPEEVVYQFIQGRDEGGSHKDWAGEQERKIREEIKVENLRMRFIDANRQVNIEGQEETEAKFNYFLGDDPGKWVNGARSYNKLIYRELYPGIDLIVSGKEGRMKNEYVVRPGAEVEKIRLRPEGAKAVRINEKGQLEVKLKQGVIIEDVPLSWQVIEGKRIEVKTEYWLDNDGVIRFEVGEYRQDKELIIDPLVYSTYFGGQCHDHS